MIINNYSNNNNDNNNHIRNNFNINNNYNNNNNQGRERGRRAIIQVHPHHCRGAPGHPIIQVHPHHCCGAPGHPIFFHFSVPSFFLRWISIANLNFDCMFESWLQIWILICKFACTWHTAPAYFRTCWNKTIPCWIKYNSRTRKNRHTFLRHFPSRARKNFTFGKKNVWGCAKSEVFSRSLAGKKGGERCGRLYVFWNYF